MTSHQSKSWAENQKVHPIFNLNQSIESSTQTLHLILGRVKASTLIPVDTMPHAQLIFLDRYISMSSFSARFGRRSASARGSCVKGSLPLNAISWTIVVLS